jgi:hypothetical protein
MANAAAQSAAVFILSLARQNFILKNIGLKIFSYLTSAFLKVVPSNWFSHKMFPLRSNFASIALPSWSCWI